MRSGFRLLLVAAALVLGACASTQEEGDVLPEETYYKEARKAMNSGNFNRAETNLDQLETYYPFGRYAEQAQLDLIYARYQNLDLEGARSAADRFLRLNPQSEYADYALYMRALASYNLDVGLATRYLGVDPTDRDPGEQRRAFEDAVRLLAVNYPESDAFDSSMRFQGRDLTPENRSLLNVVTFGLLGN
jgi:outer membrane protein assembly factor BamD